MLGPGLQQLQTGGGCSGTSQSGDASLPDVAAGAGELGKRACAHVAAETWPDTALREKVPEKVESPSAVHRREPDGRQAAGDRAKLFNAALLGILKKWGCLLGTQYPPSLSSGGRTSKRSIGTDGGGIAGRSAREPQRRRSLRGRLWTEVAALDRKTSLDKSEKRRGTQSALPSQSGAENRNRQQEDIQKSRRYLGTKEHFQVPHGSKKK